MMALSLLQSPSASTSGGHTVAKQSCSSGVSYVLNNNTLSDLSGAVYVAI